MPIITTMVKQRRKGESMYQWANRLSSRKPLDIPQPPADEEPAPIELQYSVVEVEKK